ncbi:MAG: hypothetical protein E7598_00150 [Ruminococcaceae bacterium]|nr:hypothetical protein [Oscillospiraceae bacterium]
MFAYKTDREKLYSPCKITFALLCSLFGGFVTGMCSLFFASGPYGMDVWISYLKNPYILVLNVLPPIIISACLYLLLNRAVWSFVLTNVLVIVPSLINYFKIAFRGDCFIFSDITLVVEAGRMLEDYKLFIDKRIAIYLVVLALGCALTAIFARGRFEGGKGRFIAAAVIFAASFLLVPLYTSDGIYETKTKNDTVERTWTDSRLYMSKGFVYPFLHSVKDAIPTPPNGYDKNAAAEALGAFADEVIPDDKKVNIVCVMLEAYNDFSRFKELTFTEDIYAKYRELEKMGYSGTLVTDVFAGDTRITEREFLTGLPFAFIDDFSKKSNSYVWYLRENGYTTEGSHPLNAWFYNRENINRNLGFENYYFTENYYKEHCGGDITWDNAFFPEMYKIYAGRDRSKPYFSYSISYQGHGPYDSVTASFDAPYVESGHVSEADKNIMNNFLNAQKGTTEHLYSFVKDMLETEEPLVLVFFGDHKPWMGVGGSVYTSYGINIDTSTEEGFMNYYSTRYLIIANDAAKAVCGNDFLGEGETLSAQFLMNKVFELCGYGGNSYMQFASSVMRENPIIHRSHTVPKLYEDVSYYYRRNFAY